MANLDMSEISWWHYSSLKLVFNSLLKENSAAIVAAVAMGLVEPKVFLVGYRTAIIIICKNALTSVFAGFIIWSS